MSIQSKKIQVEINGQMVEFIVNFIYTPAEPNTWDCPGDVEDVTILSMVHESTGYYADKWLIEATEKQAIADILEGIHGKPKATQQKRMVFGLEKYIIEKVGLQANF